MDPNLSDLERLARQAGEILREGFVRRPGFEQALSVEYKSLIDPVTEVDRRSDAFLVGEIQRCFPKHRIISEESGALSGEDCCVWYIDPLDGTVNFAHSLPIFSVSIAYVADGVTQLGVVYDPMQDECFSAQRGRGACLNGEPIRVSAVQDLDRCLFVTGFPYDIRTRPENNLDHFVHFSLLSQGVRRLGSAALDLCYVAAGRVDGFWEVSIKAWDIAAGSLIAQEAGAIVTDVRGGLDYLAPPQSVLAANPSIHPLLLAGLRPV